MKNRCINKNLLKKVLHCAMFLLIATYFIGVLIIFGNLPFANQNLGAKIIPYVPKIHYNKLSQYTNIIESFETKFNISSIDNKLSDSNILSEILEYFPVLSIFNHSLIHFLNQSDHSFNCRNISWIRTKSLIEKIIAPLISSYLFSGNNFFLNSAKTCANELLTLTKGKIYTAQIVNIKDKLTHSRIFETNHSMSDLSAGLLEMHSLYLLTGDEKYKRASEAILLNAKQKYNNCFHKESFLRNFNTYSKYFGSNSFIDYKQIDSRIKKSVLEKIIENGTVIEHFHNDPLLIRILKDKNLEDLLADIQFEYYPMFKEDPVWVLNLILSQEEFYQRCVFNPRGHVIYIEP